MQRDCRAFQEHFACTPKIVSSPPWGYGDDEDEEEEPKKEGNEEERRRAGLDGSGLGSGG
jgi:hypothetical protein